MYDHEQLYHNIISYDQLGHMSQFLKEREKDIKTEANNLKPDQLKDEDDFNDLIKGFKGRHLLNEVVFEEPKVVDHEQTTQKMPDGDPMWRGHERTIYIVTVEFKFSGSQEIFSYRPTGGSLPIGHLYRPSGQAVRVDVMLNELKKEEAIQKAKNEMSTTFAYIEAANPEIKRWSEQMQSDIESILTAKRKEILDFYS